MTVKLTFAFHDGQGGFSESWYDPTASIVGYDIATIRDYVAKRLQMSGQNTIIDYCRISTVGTPRSSRLFNQATFANFSLNGTFPAIGAGRFVFADSDFAGLSVMLTKLGANSNALWFFRGQPDGLVEDGGRFSNNALWLQMMQRMATFISQHSWGWFTAGRKADRTYPLTGMTSLNDFRLLMTFGNSPTGPPFGVGPAFGQHVNGRIFGQGSPANINGQITLVAQTGNTAATLRPIAITQFVQGSGKLSLPQPQLITCLNLEVNHVVRRGPGRPFSPYRGRARNRVRG